MSKRKRNLLHAPLSRRKALQLMGGAAGMAALAACAAPMPQAPATGEEGAAAPAGEMPSLLVVHRREYFKEMEDIFAQAVQDWGAENNVEIETSTVAAEAFQDFVAKTSAQVEAGDPPNLIYHIRLVQQLYFLNALEPVTDTVEQAEALYGEAPYGQRFINLIEGEWYGIPFMMHGGGQFARRSKFEEAGIDYETVLTSFDGIRDACLEISTDDFFGYGCTVNQSGDGYGWILKHIQGWGGHFTDETLSEITFNSPETIEAVSFLAEIYTSDQYTPMLPPGINAWTDSSNNEAYLAGSIGYTNNAASVYAKAKEDGNPVFEDTVVPNPIIGPIGVEQESGGGGQFNIPRGATHQDLSKALALHMIQPEIFLPISLISAGLFLPAYTDYYAMEEVVSAFAEDQNLARMGERALGDFVGASWPADPSPFFDALQAQNLLTDMMAQIIAQGMSVEEAVGQATDRIAQIGEEMGAFS